MSWKIFFLLGCFLFQVSIAYADQDNVYCLPWDQPEEMRCFYARSANCSMYNFNFENYLTSYYCTDKSYQPLVIIIFLVILILLFYALVSTTAEFFVPPLQIISESLRLSQNVAGVTLLALGNGAPDLFSAFAAINSGAPGIAFGGLFGGGIFISSMVLGLVIIVNKVYHSEPINIGLFNYTRDVFTYFLSTCIVMVILFDGKIYMWESLGILVLYSMYIFIVVLSNYIERKRKLSKLSLKGLLKISLNPSAGKIEDVVDISPLGQNFASLHEFMNLVAIFGNQKIPVAFFNDNLLKVIVPRQPEDYTEVEVHLAIDGVTISEPATFEYDYTIDLDIDETTALLNTADGKKINPFTRILNWLNFEFRWSEKKIFEKILFLGALPVMLIRFATIPPVRRVDGKIIWNKLRVIAHLIPCSFFILFLVGADFLGFVGFIPTIVLVLVIDLLLALILWATSTTGREPKYIFVYVVVSWLFAMGWVFTISQEIVSLLQTFGVIVNVSEVIIGLTVLSFANSLADMTADTLIAKLGLGEMAITATAAGPLLNLLLGAGISCSFVTLTKQDPFELKLDKLILVGIIVLLMILTFNWILMAINKFKTAVPHGGIAIGIYLIFLVITAIVEFSDWANWIPHPYQILP